MNQFNLHSALHQFGTCREFVEAFHPAQSDLIITCRDIFTPFFQDEGLKSQILFQEDFGQGEPNETMIQAMLSAAAPGYSRVIGIGGGTVLDISKLFALEQIAPLADLFQGKFAPQKKCPLILAPTTCGTGSEVTNVSIVGFPSLDTKLRLASEELYADDAVLIPELISKIPRAVFATSSIDALVHAIESSLSPLATPYSKLFGHKAMEEILSSYQKIRREGYGVLDSLLEDFMLAANFAGIAFGKAGCGAVHAMSYPLGGKYHVAHGESNYVLLTSVLKKYARKQCIPNYRETMGILGNSLGCGEKEVPEKLDALLGGILEKKPMSYYGATRDDIEPFADSVLAYQQAILSHNPTLLSREDLIDIYSDCL